MSPQGLHNLKPLAEASPERVEAAKVAIEARGDVATPGAVVRELKGRSPVFSSESVEWYTPAKYVEAARAVLGAFDLDPASNPKANETIKAESYYTIDDDALTKQWRGRVWLNPPYADDGKTNTGTWCEKLIGEYLSGRVTEGILLVNAVTDRKWFQQLWDFTLCFTDHRIAFYTPSGTPQSPVSGNVFVYFGDNVRVFEREFSGFGAVVRRVNAL